MQFASQPGGTPQGGAGGFYKVFVAFWARKSLSEGLREASGGAPEAPEAARRLPIGAKADFE